MCGFRSLNHSSEDRDKIWMKWIKYGFYYESKHTSEINPYYQRLKPFCIILTISLPSRRSCISKEAPIFAKAFSKVTRVYIYIYIYIYNLCFRNVLKENCNGTFGNPFFLKKNSISFYYFLKIIHILSNCF
jgi:hypothetical protein